MNQPDDDLLGLVEIGGRVTVYAPGSVIFAQGDPCTTIMSIASGTVTLSVLSAAGKEAVVAVLESGDFLGEGCLAGQSHRMATARTLSDATILELDKQAVMDRLRDHAEFSARFLARMLARNIRIEEALVDQLFNSTEKRLARTLLLLARYGDQGETQRVIPALSQEVLAGMVGTTRSRVNFFMNKFRKLGFIEYNGSIKVNRSLVSVVLHD
jgi:CRP-like cAMP-binding protein